MATVLEGCTTEEQSSVAGLLWAKGLNAKDIYKEIIYIYGGNCSSRKTVHNCDENRGRHFAYDEEVETERRKWSRKQTKDFCPAGFEALVKRWDKYINVGGGYVEK
jgi:hypothetical protein